MAEYIERDEAIAALESLRGALSNAGVEAAKKLIDELPGRGMNEWVRTEERLPPKGEVVIALCRDRVIRIMMRDYSGWAWVECFGEKRFLDEFIIGWADLPNQQATQK